MFQKLSLALTLSIFTISPSFGQEWARKMFQETDHDFGTVARGAKTEYRYIFENLYLEDVHISHAYASCGCTSIRVENPLVKTYEKGAIVAIFNTGTFYGQRGATITVVIDQPFYAEVQLQDRGYIRTDVEFQPSSVQVGSIDQGVGAEQTVTVNHSGSDEWQITDVKSSNPHVSAKAVETGRSYGEVSYNLQVSVAKTTPAGYLNDHLTICTNDGGSQQIPIMVEGRVQPGVMVSPAALFMGVVQPGQKVTKTLVVTGKKPFRVLGVTCSDKSFHFDTSKETVAAVLHQIPVTFVAGADAGKIMKTIKVKTDQGEMTPELFAYAVVAAAK
jgi:hypothetical protein